MKTWIMSTSVWKQIFIGVSIMVLGGIIAMVFTSFDDVRKERNENIDKIPGIEKTVKGLLITDSVHMERIVEGDASLQQQVDLIRDSFVSTQKEIKDYMKSNQKNQASQNALLIKLCENDKTIKELVPLIKELLETETSQK